MSLIGNTTAHPLGTACPKPPIRGNGARLSPTQGDHVFGDIIGVMRTGLMAIIGGGRSWGGDVGQPGRFGASVHDSKGSCEDRRKTLLWTDVKRNWEIIRNLDLGHTAAEAPLVKRERDIPEYDDHSLMFGGYSSIFQWHLCEIGYTESGSILIGSESSAQGVAWARRVMGAYDQMLQYFVDSTALNSYLAGVATRNTEIGMARHMAISKMEADGLAKKSGGDADAKGKVITICNNCLLLRVSLNKILVGMHSLNISWDNTKNIWVDFDK